VGEIESKRVKGLKRVGKVEGRRREKRQIHRLKMTVFTFAIPLAKTEFTRVAMSYLRK
jgi:hypothetical protein